MMDTILVNMPPQKRTAAFRIGLVVVASTTKGSIRSNDPDVVTLAKGVFGQFSPESRNPQVLMQRVQEAVSMDESTCKSLALFISFLNIYFSSIIFKICTCNSLSLLLI